MKLTSEQLAAKKEYITKGMQIFSDCSVTTPFTKSAPASDLDALRQRLAALQVKIEEAAAVVRRLRPS